MTRVILIGAIQFVFQICNAQKFELKPYNDYQIGFETSLGGAGERNLPFMFGFSAGTFFRIQNHQFGARFSAFEEIELFLYDKSEYQTINAYYGYMYSTKSVNFGLQIGGGHFKNENYLNSNEWHNYNLEASIYLSITKIGNVI